ncbi:hypothetical protein AB4189_11975 [Vibrio sp. 10N.286.49.E1]|uniref:hypothetical protein n=1 Tax=unclassified Vibrio TaxID=2614977 RepID=UPI00354F786C
MKKLTIALLLLVGIAAGSAYAFDDLDWHDFDYSFHHQSTHGEHNAHSCHD